ncbi:MAG: tyrosine-type recombinase/integrase, partial [Kiritimatiellaeota bacterium]|nr:tyrosine-type recombinase/integrase [Kiritimatiellota bacterium]
MAKLRKGYLFKRGKIFYACWFVSGKKMVQSTGQSDRRDAKKELARIMQPYLIQDEITTLQTVKARIEGAKAELVIYDEQRNPPLLISAAWPAYLKHPDHLDSGPQTQAAYESHYGQFRKWMKEKHPAVTALRDVTLEIAGEYVSHLTARGLSANRFNKHVRFLALLFRTLTVPAKLTSNPWLPRWRKRQVANSRRELTKDELCRVCQSAKGEMRMLFALGIYSGLRLGDCATLRWSEVDLHRGMICRIPNKTSRSNPKPVLVPLHRVLAAMLAEIPPDQREEYVIPGIAARYKADAPTLSRSITRHFVDNKVSTVKPGTGGDAKKRAVTEVGFHSLRHTFVSLCREA